MSSSKIIPVRGSNWRVGFILFSFINFLFTLLQGIVHGNISRSVVTDFLEFYGTGCFRQFWTLSSYNVRCRALSRVMGP